MEMARHISVQSSALINVQRFTRGWLARRYVRRLLSMTGYEKLAVQYREKCALDKKHELQQKRNQRIHEL